MRLPADHPPLIDWGVAARPLEGQAVSGDLHLVKPLDDGVLLAVVDGVGHGGEAVAAARAAVALYTHYADLEGMLRDAAWAQALVGQGQGADLPFCIQVDAYDVVPVARDGTLVPAGRD